ncbi:hypothetical protein [Brachyspira aalborgi]|uniref:hypothetical protein n=1 Tax=Brachyspira aalborgi TaxID=29522 RepID=UPI0013152CD9|nr:hypothetical protein [Brachyspira aalborgi]
MIEFRNELNKSNSDIIISYIFKSIKNDYNIMELSDSIRAFQNINDALYNFGINSR